MGRVILITNDDGIHADGLIRLAREAVRLGTVWLVAPHVQRSVTSHGITLDKPLDVRPAAFEVEGVRAFSCSGMPADCVRIGIMELMDTPPDVVLSGVNYGYNVASDIQYSATAAAAFEASFLGYRGIALSEDTGTCHEVTDAFLGEILEEMIDLPHGPGMAWNVNFPGCPLSECRGIWRDRTVSTEVVYDDRFELAEDLPDGGKRFVVRGEMRDQAAEGTDFHAILNNTVSVGRMRNIS